MNYTLRTSYSLTNSFEKARSIVGYLHASVIDSTEREVIFYQTADAYLRYAVSDENTESGYSVYKTSISGALLDVCAYLDMSGCPFAIVDCLQTPHGTRRTYTIQFNFQDNKADIRELMSDDVYTSLIGCSAFSRRSEEYFARSYYRGDGNGCRLVFGKRLYEYKPDFSISQVDADSLGKYAAPAFVEANLSVKYGIVILPGRQGGKGKLPMEIYKSGQLTKKIVNMPIDYEFRVWNFKTVMDSNGNCVAYALVSYTDKNKYLRYAIVELSGDELFSDNRIVWNGDDILAFDVTHSVINGEERTEILYSRDRCLYHFYIPMNKKSKVSDAVPIARDVYTFHFSIDASEPNVSAFIQRFNDAVYDEKLGDVGEWIANRSGGEWGDELQSDGSQDDESWSIESQSDAATNGIGEIFKLELSPASGTWIEESINVDDAEEQIIKRNSYVTRIAVLDENQVATSKSLKASLRASSYMHVQVNGKGYDIGPDKSVDVKTDIRGELVVTHDAYCISEEDIFLEVKSPDDKIICDDKDVLYLGVEGTGQASGVSFRGSRGIESKLTNCSGDMLMKAKDLKGAYIVPGNLRNLNSMNDFAKTVRDLLNVQTASEACSSDGCHVPMRTAVRTTSYGCFSSGRKGFFFSIEDGQTINREIDAAEFDRILSEWKEEGAKEFFSSIGDFFRAAAKGLVNSIKTIATVVGNTIKTAINFVMNGIRYVINTVVEVIQQILDIVETLFVQLTVPFIKLLEWLGDPFDFEGMRLVAQLGDAILACGEEFLKKSIYYAKKKSSLFLKDSKSRFEEAIDQIDNSSYSNATMSYLNAKGRYFQSMYQIPESDLVSDCIFDHMGDVELVGGDAVLRDLESVVSSIESVFSDISGISDGVGGESEFQSVEKDFSNAAMTGSIWQRLFSAILKAFKALGEKFFDATDKIITKLLDYAAELLSSIRQICDIRIHIPVLSVLYRSIYNKDRMTIRDLFLFSFSLTANTSSHMFCDNKRLWFLEDSVAVESAKSDIKAVIDSFDPDKIDEGLAEKSTDKESLYEASKRVQKIFDIASCWCQISSYGASAGSDALVVFKAIQGETGKTGEDGETGEGEEKRYIDGHYELKMDGMDIVGLVLDGVTAFAEIVWVSISMPAWFGDQNNILSVGAWMVCAVQCVLDIIVIFVGVKSCFPEASVTRVSCVIASILGVMYCIFSIWNVIKNVEEYKGFEIFNEAVMSLTAMLRLLLIKSLVVASSGVTAAVCMVTDFIAAVSGVARFVLVVDNSSGLAAGLSAEVLADPSAGLTSGQSCGLSSDQSSGKSCGFSSDRLGGLSSGLSSGFGWGSMSLECVGGA